MLGFTKLQVESICVEMSALVLKVMCPCLKEPRFVVVEAATSFQDVHAMFFKKLISYKVSLFDVDISTC